MHYDRLLLSKKLLPPSRNVRRFLTQRLHYGTEEVFVIIYDAFVTHSPDLSLEYVFPALLKCFYLKYSRNRALWLHLFSSGSPINWVEQVFLTY